MENLKDLDLEIASLFLGGESISTTGDTPRNRMTKKTFEKYRRKLEKFVEASSVRTRRAS